MTKKNKFVHCGIYLQPETGEELCSSPAKPQEAHRSPDNIEAPLEPESLPPAHLPVELRAWHPCSERPPLPGGLPRVCIHGKTFSGHCFSLMCSKQLCKGATRAVTSHCSPLPHVLPICDSMSKHTRVSVSMKTVGKYMQTCLGKLHSYCLADFQPSAATVPVILWLLLSLLLWLFFNFPLIIHIILVAMQCFQAQPSVTIPHHGCGQLGCSMDALLINLPFLHSYFGCLEIS